MFEYEPQEVYENDLETWETNRVYEDMAIERAEAEAEAEEAMFRAYVEDVVIDVMVNLGPTLPLDIVQRIAERIITHQLDKQAEMEDATSFNVNEQIHAAGGQS